MEKFNKKNCLFENSMAKSILLKSPLLVPGIIMMDNVVYAYQVEKPFLIFDTKSYVTALTAEWREDKQAYQADRDKLGELNVSALIVAAEMWLADSSCPAPYDLSLQIRLAQGPLRVNGENLKDYLCGVLSQPYSIPIPPPSIESDEFNLQSDIVQEYAPQFVIIADHKPHPIFGATKKLRAALRNVGNEIDSQLVEEDELMRLAMPYILAVNNAAHHTVEPRISPKNILIKAGVTNTHWQSVRTRDNKNQGKAKRRTRQEEYEEQHKHAEQLIALCHN